VSSIKISSARLIPSRLLFSDLSCAGESGRHRQTYMTGGKWALEERHYPCDAFEVSFEMVRMVLPTYTLAFIQPPRRLKHLQEGILVISCRAIPLFAVQTRLRAT